MKLGVKIIIIISSVSLAFLLIFALTNYYSEIKTEAEIQEKKAQVETLKKSLENYQDIYNEALSTYQKYSTHSGDPEWDYELSKTKKIMDEAQREIYKIKRSISIYENYIETHEKKDKNNHY